MINTSYSQEREMDFDYPSLSRSPLKSPEEIQEIIDYLVMMKNKSSSPKSHSSLSLSKGVNSYSQDSSSYHPNYSIILKNKALNFINNSYDKYIIVKEGEGFFIIAHSKKIKVLTPLKGPFQESERSEEKEMCTLSIIQYDRCDDTEIRQFNQLKCEIHILNR